MSMWNRISFLSIVAVGLTFGANALADCGNESCGQDPKAKADLQKMLPLPAKMPAVAATVGTQEITGDEVNAMVAQAREQILKQFAVIPDEQKRKLAMYIQPQLALMPDRMRNQLVLQVLLHNYVAKNNIVATKAGIDKIRAEIAASAKQKGLSAAEFKERNGLTDAKIRKQAQVAKLVETTLSEKNIAAFIAKNPSFFNGTNVQAQHIFLQCDGTPLVGESVLSESDYGSGFLSHARERTPFQKNRDAIIAKNPSFFGYTMAHPQHALLKCRGIAPTAEQKKATTQLEAIAADIKAGKTTFAQAAAANSQCPSGKKGGALGEFTFALMVPPFSTAAYATKIGETTPVVRTRFGFHIIKAGKRVEGKEAVDPKNENTIQLAKNIIMAQLMNKVLDQALTTCPITYPKAPAATKTN
jgi:parvulin-like peptidyl-prolyl isomerase